MVIPRLDLSGKTVAGRYLLQDRVGSGRMSTVYRALDQAAGDAYVAVKILNTDHPDDIKREVFKRETAALKRLNHSNIVGLRESGFLDDECAFYLVLDYLPHTLDGHLRGDGQLPPERFDPYRVMRELAQALAHAHSQNVIHRDIKPSNILLDDSGRPCLSDFGISKLLTDLSIGHTLAGFWSPGYAAPEQQAGKPASFKSDIYSLGAVFYHLLSGRVPLPEGPTPLAVGYYVPASADIRTVLEGMLAEKPDERDYTSTGLAAAVEGLTRQVETLPKQYLILTNASVRNLREIGRINSDDRNEAWNVIKNNLGGMELNEVYVQADRQEAETIRILGDTLRLVCKLNEERNGLVVVAVHAPYLPELEQQKERAMPYRAVWEPVQSSDEAPSNDAVAGLIGHLVSFEQENTAERENRRSRRAFIEQWQSALERQERRIGESGLRYSEVSDEGDHYLFTLSEPPPDNLGWDEEAPLAVEIPGATTTRQPRTEPVGSLGEVRGRSLVVYKEDRRSRSEAWSIPETGRLALNQIEARSAITRQRRAIRAFLFEDMANPKLANVIVDPDRATHLPAPPLDYYQDWLSDDKKDAVSKAVASNELFLIQGPPGTGKTSVIAEIALQILCRNPDARILLSSQSNVAVDHALRQIAEAAGASPPAMIRLGRSEKINNDDWTVTGRAETLQREVREKCGTVLAGLTETERRLRADARNADLAANPDDASAPVVAEWIEEARTLLDELRECELQSEIVRRGRSAGIMQAHITARVEDIQGRLKDQFDALAEIMSLPLEYTGTNADEVLTQIIRAAAPSTAREIDLTGPAAELRKVQEKRRIIGEWMQIAGRPPDMMKLIIEQSSIVAATCLYSGGNRMPDAAFDWAIIDEAGRATVPEVLVAIAKAYRVILVGDERQLPPMVDDAAAGDASEISDTDYPLDTSLFQTLVEQAEEAGQWHLAGLRRQYRMHPAIGNLISKVFYDGKLEQGRDACGFPDYGWMRRRVSWLTTAGLPDKLERRRGQSFANHCEIDALYRWLQDFEQECRQRSRHPLVGIISGYQAQVSEVERRVDPGNAARWQNLQIEVATVDSFQGRECDVVLYSTVRSNLERRIGFLRDARRVNVALSRAKDALVIVGDDVMMRNAETGVEENPFAKVLAHIRSHPNECEIVPANLGGL